MLVDELMNNDEFGFNTSTEGFMFDAPEGLSQDIPDFTALDKASHSNVPSSTAVESVESDVFKIDLDLGDTEYDFETSFEAQQEYGVETFFITSGDNTDVGSIASFSAMGFTLSSAFVLTPTWADGNLILTMSRAFLENKYEFSSKLDLKVPKVCPDDSITAQRLVVLLYFHLRQLFRDNVALGRFLRQDFVEVGADSLSKIKNPLLIEVSKLYAHMIFTQFKQAVTQ